MQRELCLDDLNENPNQLAVTQTLNPFAQGVAPQTRVKFVYNWANYGV